MTLVSTLGQALDQIERIKQQQVNLGTLQEQLATGKIAQTFSGLDTNIITSERSRANINQIDTYINNMTKGNVRLEQMLAALDNIQSQAENVVEALVAQPQEGDVDLAIIKRVAETAFDFVVQMLNTQDGDDYLFAGSDSSNPPIRDTGTLDSFFQSLNAEWSPGTLTINPPNTDVTEEYIDRYENISDADAGYSQSLNNSKPVLIRIDDEVEVDYTKLANDPALKEILVILGNIKNMPDVQDAPGAGLDEKKDNFFRVFNDLTTKLTRAIDDVDSLKFDLNSVQVIMQRTEELHILDKKNLENTVADVEDVDLAETATKLQFLQVQLEATYRVTASIRQFSLVNFI
jgi:flagellar hook-associated protein 3 FlgL